MISFNTFFNFNFLNLIVVNFLYERSEHQVHPSIQTVEILPAFSVNNFGPL